MTDPSMWKVVPDIAGACEGSPSPPPAIDRHLAGGVVEERVWERNRSIHAIGEAEPQSFPAELIHLRIDADNRQAG